MTTTTAILTLPKMTTTTILTLPKMATKTNTDGSENDHNNDNTDDGENDHHAITLIIIMNICKPPTPRLKALSNPGTAESLATQAGLTYRP